MIFHQTIRIVYELITCLVPASHSSGLYKCFAKTLQGVRGFEGPEPPISLHGPAVNLSLLPTLTFWYCLASLCFEHKDLGFGNNFT